MCEGVKLLKQLSDPFGYCEMARILVVGGVLKMQAQDV